MYPRTTSVVSDLIATASARDQRTNASCAGMLVAETRTLDLSMILAGDSSSAAVTSRR